MARLQEAVQFGESDPRLFWVDRQQKLGALNTVPVDKALDRAVHAVRGPRHATITESSAA